MILNNLNNYIISKTEQCIVFEIKIISVILMLVLPTTPSDFYIAFIILLLGSLLGLLPFLLLWWLTAKALKAFSERSTHSFVKERFGVLIVASPLLFGDLVWSLINHSILLSRSAEEGLFLQTFFFDFGVYVLTSIPAVLFGFWLLMRKQK